MADDINKFLKDKAENARLYDSAAKPAGYVLDEAENFLVKGAKELPNNAIQKVISGDTFKDKLASILKSRAASKALGTAKTGLKSIPFLGPAVVGLGTLAATGDASAATQSALPLVGDTDDVGPASDSLEFKLENGTATPEELEVLRNRFQ